MSAASTSIPGPRTLMAANINAERRPVSGGFYLRECQENSLISHKLWSRPIVRENQICKPSGEYKSTIHASSKQKTAIPGNSGASEMADQNSPSVVFPPPMDRPRITAACHRYAFPVAKRMRSIPGRRGRKTITQISSQNGATRISFCISAAVNAAMK